MAESSAYELWKQAGGDSTNYNQAEYLRLMREHGHLIPLKPGEKAEPLPCGWPHKRADPDDDQSDLDDLLDDPAVEAAYRDAQANETLLTALIAARKAARMTPEQVAQGIGGKDPRTDKYLKLVKRYESGELMHDGALWFVRAYARAVGVRVATEVVTH